MVWYENMWCECRKSQQYSLDIQYVCLLSRDWISINTCKSIFNQGMDSPHRIQLCEIWAQESRVGFSSDPGSQWPGHLTIIREVLVLVLILVLSCVLYLALDVSNTVFLVKCYKSVCLCVSIIPKFKTLIYKHLY